MPPVEFWNATLLKERRAGPTPAPSSDCRDLHRKAREAARSADDRAYIASDLRWHEAVWQSTGNTCLADTLRRVVIPLFGFSAITSHHGFNLVRDADSCPLLEAIRKHDPAEAGMAFEKFSEVWQQQVLSESEAKPLKRRRSK